jgi:ribonuclease HII
MSRGKKRTWSDLTPDQQSFIPDTGQKHYRSEETNPYGIARTPWPSQQETKESKESPPAEGCLYIDEAGRGAWAGPLAIGIIYLPGDFDRAHLPGMHDSKLLHEHERLLRYHTIKHCSHLMWHVEQVPREIIDEMHMGQAWRWGIQQAIDHLLAKLEQDKRPIPRQCILDGDVQVYHPRVEIRAVPKADSRYVGVAMASIMAKCSRDLYMKAIAPIYSEFQEIFEKGKGYAHSARHRELILQGTFTDLHRLSFRPLATYLAKQKK